MSSPRSFRFPPRLLERLKERARLSGVTVSALVERYVDEGTRRDDHPLIVFRDGAAGRRPALVGTRLDVWQVVDTLRHSGNSVDDAAEYLGLPAAHVRAAVRYYAEFRDEIDEWRERELEFAAREEEAWRREQAALV